MRTTRARWAARQYRLELPWFHSFNSCHSRPVMFQLDRAIGALNRVGTRSEVRIPRLARMKPMRVKRQSAGEWILSPALGFAHGDALSTAAAYAPPRFRPA